MSKITCRIADQTAEWLQNHFDNRTAGGEYVLDAFPTLYRRCLHALRGKFDRGELMLVLDVLNGHFLTPGLVGQALELECADGIALNALDRKWKIDRDVFLGKVASLTVFERSCLEVWGRGFWASGSWEKPDGEIEWMRPLLREADNG